jgi:chemotaxis protein methyltransferase CheR
MGPEPQGGFEPLAEAEFCAFQRLVEQRTGIHVPRGKLHLLQMRLAPRMRHHQLARFSDYYDLVTRGDPDRVEWGELVNQVTTNKTEFHREPHHLAFLTSTILPELASREPDRRRLRIWSAGCSSGEEPYSIAMTVLDALGAAAASWDVRVLATDIDTSMLERTARAIYDDSVVARLPFELRRRHFLRGTAANAGTWRAKPALRRLVHVRQLNLSAAEWSLDTAFDAIFCRNVLIYFRPNQQRRTLERLASALTRSGYLFLGHAETMGDRGRRLVAVAHTVYRAAAHVVHSAEPTAPPASSPGPPRRRIILGELHASREPVRITTLLGSCVSACLFDPEAGVGGMNHFFLPDGHDGELGGARFGVHAMELLINEIMKLGGDRRRLRAKAFGAGSVLATETVIPARNAEFVRSFLKTEGIPLVGDRLGGRRPLEVHFFPRDGRALVRTVEPAAARELASREAAARSRLIVPAAPDPDKVTLF